MSLNDALKTFRNALAASNIDGVTIRHYWRSGLKAPFLVWAETGDNDNRWGDNRLAYRNVGGVLDYYTKTEFDPNVDEIESVFDSLDCSWYLSDVLYEEDTNLIHYSWVWNMGA